MCSRYWDIRVQSLEMENSILKNEIHDLKTLLNTITTSLSCKSKTTETQNTLNEKSDCQEVFNELEMLITALII